MKLSRRSLGRQAAGNEALASVADAPARNRDVWDWSDEFNPVVSGVPSGAGI